MTNKTTVSTITWIIYKNIGFPFQAKIQELDKQTNHTNCTTKAPWSKNISVPFLLSLIYKFDMQTQLHTGLEEDIKYGNSICKSINTIFFTDSNKI